MCRLASNALEVAAAGEFLQVSGFARWFLDMESVLDFCFQMGGSDTHLAWAYVQLFGLICTIDLC